MKAKYIINIALNSLKEYKLRSSLTLISIVLGIATLVSLVLISQSMEKAVGERLGGTVDVIRVLPGHVIPGRDVVTYGSFTEASALAVEEHPHVAATSTWMVEIATAEYNGKSSPVEIMGGNPEDIKEFMGGSVEIKEGRLINGGASNEAILSTSTLEHINRWLDSDLKVNDILKINGVDFTIVGVMAYDLAGVEVSHRLLISKEDMKAITDSDDVMLMLVKVNDLDKVDIIKEEIEDILDKFHGVSGLTTAIAAETVVDQVGMVTKIIQSVVIAIAIIALIIGCLGIVNVMMMTVFERTRDIGIMKAIGGKDKNIVTLFLVESGIISLIGGILGVIGGILISLLVNILISKYIITEMKIIINPYVIIGGLLVGLITGIIGGLYPAMKASKMKPVDALKYE